MQLVEARLCPMGNRKFVPHPVGADAHIGPLGSYEFAEDFRKTAYSAGGHECAVDFRKNRCILPGGAEPRPYQLHLRLTLPTVSLANTGFCGMIRKNNIDEVFL